MSKTSSHQSKEHGALGALLYEVGRRAGLSLDPLAARRLASDAQGPSQSDWFHKVQRVFRGAGIQPEVQTIAPEKIDTTIETPIMTRTTSGGYVLLERVTGKEAVILRINADARWFETVPLSDLAEIIGVEPHSEVVWLMPRVERPLSSMGKGRSVWRRLWALTRFESRSLGAVVIYAISVGLLSLATPIAVQSLFSTVAFGTFMQPLVVLSLLLASALTFAAILKVFEMVVVEQIQQRIFVRVATDFARRISDVRRDSLLGGRLSEKMNRFYDVVTVEKALSSIVFDGLSAILQITVGMALLAVYHPILLAFDLGMVIVLALILVALGRHGIATSIKESKDKHAVAAWLQEMSDREVFRSLRGANYGVLRAESLIDRWLSHRRRHFRVVLRQAVGIVGLQVGATVLLVLIGGVLVIERQLTLGQLVAAELVMTATVASFAKMAKLFGKFYDLLAGLDKIGHVVELELEPPAGRELEDAGDDGISLRYMRSGPVSAPLEIPARSRYLVDTNDSSEAAELLGVFSAWRLPSRGRLFFNEIDAHDLSRSHLRDDIMILRGNELFEGSIFDNLSLGEPGIGRTEVWAALKGVGLESMVRSLPEGLDSNLSLGPFEQHTALMLVLARALLHRPGLIVIDGTIDSLPEPMMRVALRVLVEEHAPWTLVCRTGRADVHNALSSKRLSA